NLRTPKRPEIALLEKVLSGRMRNFNQHLPGRHPENLRTPKRPEIALLEKVLSGRMRNFN
ncbi:MAG: hypothetical protein K2L18_10090, partial [Acetatifactor sp.]|nr:hypothetical protein [Acetatifactor sp.]